MKNIDLFMSHFAWSYSGRKAVDTLAYFLGKESGPCPKDSPVKTCCHDCKLCWTQYLESEVSTNDH